MVMNNFLTDSQFGFKEKHSTSMAILRPVDQIASEIDKGNVTLGVLITLSKAFDTIVYLLSMYICCKRKNVLIGYAAV